MDGFVGTGAAPGARLLRIVGGGRVGNRWLILLRVSWVVLGLVAVAIPTRGIPLVFGHLRTPCAAPTTCADTGQVAQQSLRLLEDLGLSLDLYAKLSVAVPAAAAAV